MAKIIRLPGDEPHEIQLLLPWYVTGELDQGDRARVEAHLRVCARCRAELGVERKLEREVSGLALDIEHGWAALQPRLDEPRSAAARLGALAGHVGAVSSSGGAWLGWALAASLAVVVVFGVVAPRSAPSAAYHTLSSAAAVPTGNVLVMFRATATADALAGVLKAADARLADGPTAAGAYVLRVPGAARPHALQVLRQNPNIVLAEPLDQGPPP